MTIVLPGLPLRWKEIAKELAPLYPSKNRGYSTSHRQVYAEIAQREGVSLRTVQRYMNRATLKREYARERARIERHLEIYLPRFFNGNSELSLSELAGRIKQKMGILIRESTLEKLLGKYEGTERSPPVVKAESGNYQLSGAYYKRNGNK